MDNFPSGHVFASVITNAFDHCVSARVPNGESLADYSAQECLPAGGTGTGSRYRPIDVLLSNIVLRDIVRRPHHNPATGQALADVVVGVAVDTQRDPLGTKAPKLLPADPVKVMSMVPSGSPWPP